jgi:hypothetical protein
MRITIVISFGPKKDYTKGGEIKLYNEDLYSLYSSPDIWGVIELRLIWQDMQHAWTKQKIYTEISFANLTVKD